MATKIALFEKMARKMVGDGKKPNIYFVGRQGVIVGITSNRDLADEMFDELMGGEVTLEDRLVGVVRDKGGPH